MYQRLLFILSTLFISGVSMAQSVINSGDGDYIYNAAAPTGSSTNPIPSVTLNAMQKWVHDPTQRNRIGSFQKTFKSYRYNTLSFRLRFPNNYDSTKRYPLVIFLHGEGEAYSNFVSPNTITVDRENQDQLYWGASTFEQRMNQGEWNGFLLFPQLGVDIHQSGAQWDNSSFPLINGILDTLEKSKGLDPDRVIVMGLSAGGVGSVNYAGLHPKRIATVVASSPKEIESGLTDIADNIVQIPIWISGGGTDTGPNPGNTFYAYDVIGSRGTNLYLSYYANKDHDTWETQWAQTDIYQRFMLSTYWNAAHKAQPVVYFQNTEFCTGKPISAKMGLTPGFYTYEWQRDNGSGFTTIAGATSNIYTATQAGKYQARFKRTASADWSAWSPSPVIISTKKCSVDTAFAEHFDEIPIAPYVAATPSFNGTAYTYQNFTCQSGLFPTGTEVFTQDGAGRQGGRFMLNNTTSNCTYASTDQVWRIYSPATVQPNTNYTFSFTVGNQTNFYNSSTAPSASLTASINHVNLTPAGGVKTLSLGNVSWKKFSYTWNSGSNTSAELAIINNTTNPTWNDFVLDEITLAKYKTPVMPGGKNVTLWTKAGSIIGFDGSSVPLWSNDDVNGNSLQQDRSSRQPLLKNNANDNINFNPVVSYVRSSNKSMMVANGFAGTSLHNSANIYMVVKSGSISQNGALLREGQGSGIVLAQTFSGGIINWSAGGDLTAANSLTTPSNTNELNKPILWTFSKNTIDNTPSGNKLDIRKNGIVVAAKNTGTSFTGNNENLTVGTFDGTSGTFDGNIAEIVYVLDSNITPLTQNRIESYLALKYGTSLGSTAAPVNYTASDSTTVFWTADANYQNDVFGIGTDSASGLVQTISNSVNSGTGSGAGLNGKGNLVLSTSTELADKRFLMIGNNAGSLAQHVITSGAEASAIAQGATIVGRKWKVYNTGSVGAVDLSFDSTGLNNQAGGNNVNNYALMIDLDGDGNFATGTLSFFTATSGSGKKINFSGVTLNNGVVFTLITLKSAALLPAVWLGFTAEAVSGNAVLNWTTGDEMNVDRYMVEHSFNGVSFSVVGSVSANNNSGVNKYTFTHAGLAPGIHYYRIRRIDKDGKGEYSDTKSIKISTTGANVQVRPNPVVGANLQLAVSTSQGNKTNIQVMGVDGKVIVQQNINLAAGNNMVNINIANVPPGIYLVRVQLSNEVVTKKFIKER